VKGLLAKLRMVHFVLPSLFERIRKFASCAGPGRCNVCDSKSATLFLNRLPAALYRCEECGLIFFSPLPSKKVLEDFYSSEEGYLPSIRETLDVYKTHYTARAARYENFMDRILKQAPGSKSVLDVGCGYGLFLLYCREKGFDTWGIEISKQTSAWAREQQLDVFTGSVHEAPFDNNYFDIVTSFHCLEHALDPQAELLKMASFCRKRGILLVAVPNAFSFAAEYSFASWPWNSWPNHLYYFSPRNLKIVLAKTGFEVLEIYSQAGDSDVNIDTGILGRILKLDAEERDEVLKLLYELNKGQELVVLARRRG